MFDYSIHLFYNTEGQLIRKEHYKDGFMTDHLNYHYENGRMVSMYPDGCMPLECDTIFYDDAGNVIKHTTGLIVWNTNYYEYDNHPKPNFGIDYLFAFQPLPGQGTVASDEMCLSQNNMTKMLTQRESRVYTYNEFGLPETYEIIWEGIPTSDPMIFYITYKQIDLGITEPVQSKLVVYPNPTKGQLTIDNGQLTIGDIEIFDIYGRNIYSFTRSLAHSSTTNIDISHLPAGIYFLRMGGETVKVVKQ